LILIQRIVAVQVGLLGKRIHIFNMPFGGFRLFGRLQTIEGRFFNT